MFDIDDLYPCTTKTWFKQGYQQIERTILEARLGLATAPESAPERQKLVRFCQAVIASAPQWHDPRHGKARELCIFAADLETGLGIWESIHGRLDLVHDHFLKAALLYDLAGMPGTAATIALRNGIDTRLKDFFARQKDSVWGTLAVSQNEVVDRLGRAPVPDVTLTSDRLLETAIGETIAEYGREIQIRGSEFDAAKAALAQLTGLAGDFALRLTADDLSAFGRSVQLRKDNATLSLIERYSPIPDEVSRAIRLPLELWPVQRRAIEAGLLASTTVSYGLAAPTGTGKTSLTRALIAAVIAEDDEKKIIYVSPSRALVHQVAFDLSTSLNPAGIIVRELGAHLTIHEQLGVDSEDAQVLVFTPERADLLMRVDKQFIKSIGLVIVDEAHHIEQGTRGILLEFYLWRLRRLVPSEARIVQLSAVTPNISELVDWLGEKSESTAVKVDWRTNRLRLGIFERRRDGSGLVKFEGIEPFSVFGPGEFPEDRVLGLATLAHRLSSTGIVLVLSTSVKGAERIAATIASLREQISFTEGSNPILERLDAKIERELYPEAPLRWLLKRRVAYHHAQLPPNVRTALEEAITSRHVDVVCATTTLAEGVNFPFSTVVVESLVGKDYELTPRALWNIAGRAGRFGVDSEGHCIIFEPSAFTKKLQEYKLEDYLRTNLDDIPPVKSALGGAISELKEAVDKGSLPINALSYISLNSIIVNDKPRSAKSRRIRGLINLVRVGYTHANTSNLLSLDDADAPEFRSETLAARQMAQPVRDFAVSFGTQQRQVVKNAFAGKAELMEIAARVGWSLETQAELHDWLKDLEPWQLQNFGRIVVGGHIPQVKNLGYLLGPVSKLMAEFEGEKLGGITAFVAKAWIEGLPLIVIRDQQTEKDFGKLVRMIYARVQYLLPWALYGVNELIHFEAKRRGIKVMDGVRDLSVLAAEGVPDFDALQLVLSLGLERVDATRIAQSYRRKASRQTDVVGYLKGISWNELVGIVRGPDRRRVDPDLAPVWEAVRAR